MKDHPNNAACKNCEFSEKGVGGTEAVISCFCHRYPKAEEVDPDHWCGEGRWRLGEAIFMRTEKSSFLSKLPGERA